MATKEQLFIDTISPYAVSEMVRTFQMGKPVLASVKIAQACLETGYGKSVPNGNYFGVKGKGNTFQTQEWDGAKYITITASFAAFDSMEASVIGHSQFLIENSRYTKNGVFDAAARLDWAGMCDALQKAGYATDPSYSAKLQGIIRASKLHQYDKEAGEMLQAIEQLQKTVAAQAADIKALKEKASMPTIPAFAISAVHAAVKAGVVDEKSASGGSYDFYRMVTIMHRKGLF